MQLPRFVRAGIVIAASLSAAVCLCAQAPTAGLVKAEGLPPRAAPADYQAHAAAGSLTVAAEFMGHAIATPDINIVSEEYVAVEVALYGPPDTRSKLSYADFSIRINGKKTPTPSRPPGMIYSSLKDPSLEPTAEETKSKTSINSGGGGQAQPDSKPPPFKVPYEIRRGWEQHVQKASLSEGERALPKAGLIFFPYRGKTEKIESLELIYTGASGTATMNLQP